MSALHSPPALYGYRDGFEELDPAEANALCVAWDHDLGPCNRPFGMQAWAFAIDGQRVAVAISASTVSATLRGSLVDVQWRRDEVVELARLCAANHWANRVMLRWWREVAALRWPYWPIRAAVSYSDRGKTGNLYRLDGWRLIADNCGSSGGGTWTGKRTGNHKGKKLWDWRYPTD